MLGLGIDLIHVPSKRGKNAADIRIVIDAMEMMVSSNHITHVFLVSGDGDFTELVHRLRANGKVVVGMGISGASAEYLINACDQFIFYDKLVGAEDSKDEADENETAVDFAHALNRPYGQQTSTAPPLEQRRTVSQLGQKVTPKLPPSRRRQIEQRTIEHLQGPLLLLLL